MSSTSSPPKSPILAALGISVAIAVGSMVASLDMAQVEAFATGQWLTRPLAEAQQRQAASIAALEQSVGKISKDIDFVTARVSTTIRRNEDQAFDRIAHLDAEIAALKDKIAGIQHARVTPARAPEAPPDLSGLRSSLTELSAAHTGAVAAITRRLDRIEVMVGLTTDLTSSVSDPAAQRARRAVATKHKKPVPPVDADSPIPELKPAAASITRPEHGHLFNVKPLSQQGKPLRVSRLPG